MNQVFLVALVFMELVCAVLLGISFSGGWRALWRKFDRSMLTLMVLVLLFFMTAAFWFGLRLATGGF